jgi:ATP-binding cassette, subfamily G (WHITE), member 2, PDR
MPFMNQLQPKWKVLASLYSFREKPSKIYNWSIFVLSNIVIEIPYNAVTGTLFFILAGILALDSQSPSVV